MKVWIFIAFVLAGCVSQVFAQSEKLATSRIVKGESFVNLKIQTTRKNQINESFYLTKSVGVGGGYYFLNRIALKAGIMGQQYEALDISRPTLQEFHNKNLLLYTGQIRCNFWEIPGLGSVFLQSGYSYGKFTGEERAAIKRWEILSLGHTLYIKQKGFQNFGMEVGLGLEKEKGNREMVVPMFFGLNYYFRKL